MAILGQLELKKLKASLGNSYRLSRGEKERGAAVEEGTGGWGGGEWGRKTGRGRRPFQGRARGETQPLATLTENFTRKVMFV